MLWRIARTSWVWLFKIIVIGILIFLLWCGWGYTQPNNFPIKQVKIVAAYEHLDQTSLRDVINPYTKNGFFYLDVIGMKRQLLKFPWVYAVSVQRKWPDTIVINIVEQQAVLQWGTQALINHHGVFFTPEIASFPKDLPIIFGPEERKLEIFNLYQKSQQYFEPLDLSIKQLVLNPQHYWEMLLSNDTVVFLKENELLDQIELLTGLYRRITAAHQDSPKTIDLRYNTDSLAVKWE